MTAPLSALPSTAAWSRGSAAANVFAKFVMAPDSCSGSMTSDTSEKASWLGGPPLSSMNSLKNSCLHSAQRANPAHDELPDSVAGRATASISIKPCFVALLLRGSPTPWKIARNPSIFCLRTLLFVVVLTRVCHQAAERKIRNFKSESTMVCRNALAAKFNAAISKVLQLDAGTRSLPAQ